MGKKHNIAFIESNIDGTVGGSHFSLLHLVSGLSEESFNKTVVFYQENTLVPIFEEAGCEVIIFNKRTPLNLVGQRPGVNRKKSALLVHMARRVMFALPQKAINFFSSFILDSFRTYKILTQRQIKIVHLNNTLLRPQEWISSSAFAGVKVVAHERGINDRFPIIPRFWALFINRIICISDAVKKNLLAHGFREKKLTRIYNGIDSEKFRAKRKYDVKAEFGFSESSAVVGILGNLKEWKGQHVVIEAMTEVANCIPEVKCLVVGGASPADEGYRQHLVDMVSKLGLGSVVHFTGERSDVPDLIAAMDVVIHSSVLPEPFGRVLLEGMVMEKPVITTAIGAGPEVIVHGETGLIVPPGNPGALSEGIMQLLEDPSRAKNMGRNGRKRAERDFDIRLNIEMTENLYRSLLS